jgi:cytochrome bd ubiquinol oxidase subunit II
LRGISLEVSGHINDRLWQGFWDTVFMFSNFLLAILFGAAAGNLQRGVPLDAQGNFSMAFFTDFKPYGDVGLLDWYTVSVAIFMAVLLAAHGATYLALKTEGPVQERSGRWAKRLWAAVVPLFIIISVQSWQIRPVLFQDSIRRPICLAGCLVIVIFSLVLISGLASGHERRAFVGSNGIIAGILGTGAAALFPIMLYSTLAPENSLTAYGVAAHPNSLLIASIWWPIGFVLAMIYFVFISRRYGGKSSVRKDNQGFYD